MCSSDLGMTFSLLTTSEGKKNLIHLRCELRRRLAPIEMRSIRTSAFRSLGIVSGGIAAGGIVLDLLQELRRLRRRR